MDTTASGSKQSLKQTSDGDPAAMETTGGRLLKHGTQQQQQLVQTEVAKYLNHRSEFGALSLHPVSFRTLLLESDINPIAFNQLMSFYEKHFHRNQTFG